MESKNPTFFSCILDDFQDYIYEGFGTILNKSRSANVGVVFCHQSLGDLDKVSEAFRNVVLTNTNIKIVMRMNDPKTCEHFATTFGTKTTTKITQKISDDETTGDGSVRDVEEFIYHPNEFKTLGLGQGVLSVPHRGGVKLLKVKFKPLPDLPRYKLPKVKKKLLPRKFPAKTKQKTVDVVDFKIPEKPTD
ncbi:MAG: TraM recognition domain-containing protein [Pseudobdellovibrionaceae bacterium]